MTKDLDVLVIGRNCIDYIAIVERFPEEDEKAPLIERRIEGGGQAGTSACCVARLGGNVALVGNIGNDDEGKFCIRRLKDFNVNTDYIQRLNNHRTPVAYLFVTRSSGKRTIIYEPSLLPPITMDDSLAQLMSNAKTISLDPQTTYLAQELKENRPPGTRIIYDCERWLDHIEDMMDIADYFIPSSVFFNSKPEIFNANSLHGNTLILGEMVKGQAIVTHGADGAYYPFQGRLYQVKAPVVEAVDTTGAGDNFHGAFALALSKGLDLHKSVKLAVSVASLSCRGYGGREALPDWQEAYALARQLQYRIV
jgi:sugar/nucleoside kinase (ribokinase family)